MGHHKAVVEINETDRSKSLPVQYDALSKRSRKLEVPGCVSRKLLTRSEVQVWLETRCKDFQAKVICVIGDGTVCDDDAKADIAKEVELFNDYLDAKSAVYFERKETLRKFIRVRCVCEFKATSSVECAECKALPERTKADALAANPYFRALEADMADIAEKMEALCKRIGMRGCKRFLCVAGDYA